MSNHVDLTRYRSLVFDCDGVVLDSNAVKTDAFRAAAAPYGEEGAERLVAYHLAHGGVSRYVKFRYFLESILGRQASESALQPLLAAFANLVRSSLMTCAVADGLDALRLRTAHATWMIASGGDQCELGEVFAARQLDRLFDAGIFGSPDTKATILGRELERGAIRHPALYLGDSRLDHDVATRFGLDFCFVSAWTDLRDWRALQRRHGFAHVERLACLIAS